MQSTCCAARTLHPIISAMHMQPLRHFACVTASTFLCAAACSTLRFAAASLFLCAAACTILRFAAASRPASTTSALEGCRTCRASSVNHAGVQMHQTATPENMVVSLPLVSHAHQERRKRRRKAGLEVLSRLTAVRASATAC